MMEGHPRWAERREYAWSYRVDRVSRGANQIEGSRTSMAGATLEQFAQLA